MMAHSLAHADGEATVEGLRRADRVRDTAKVCKRREYSRSKHIAGVGHCISIARQANTGRNICGPRAAVKSRAHALIRIDKAGQVDAFGHGEICVRGIVTNELLFVAGVRGVDARILIVLAENRYADPGWRRRSRGRRILNRAGIGAKGRWSPEG